ncbi:protein PIMREG [Hemicordylus capensis]|uniref:protein PIMREG n=1 Tax=Hemicordylus capensis TaxID=884348 RepID=UPI0023039123|nr:protein PIMREG [Hemicordylus capensis]XP_053130754.1 protein PIMREG [Hemicordylus capensis]XP_053130755.1 protein PIMREG [Hemicordylus capensis]
MASVFHSVGASMGWRNHEILSDFEESPLPDRFWGKPFRNLSAVRMSLRKWMPLKEVEINFDKNPTWESLEAKDKAQHRQALTRTAKNVLRDVSQQIQKHCQGPARILLTTLSKASTKGGLGSTRPQAVSPRALQRKSQRMAAVSTPTSTTKILSGSDKSSSFQPDSRQRRREVLPLRRSRQAAALRSPYGSLVSAGCRRQFDCDLVSTGIRKLKHLSQTFNDIIVQEERDQAVTNYYQVMAQNLQAAHSRSRKLSCPAFGRRTVRLRRTLRSWADNRFNSINL